MTEVQRQCLVGTTRWPTARDGIRRFCVSGSTGAAARDLVVKRAMCILKIECVEKLCELSREKKSREWEAKRAL